MSSFPYKSKGKVQGGKIADEGTGQYGTLRTILWVMDLERGQPRNWSNSRKKVDMKENQETMGKMIFWCLLRNQNC